MKRRLVILFSTAVLLTGIYGQEDVYFRPTDSREYIQDVVESLSDGELRSISDDYYSDILRMEDREDVCINYVEMKHRRREIYCDCNGAVIAAADSRNTGFFGCDVNGRGGPRWT